MTNINVKVIESTNGNLVRFTGEQLNHLVSLTKDGAEVHTQSSFGLNNDSDLKSLFLEAMSGNTESFFVFENNDQDLHALMAEAIKENNYSLNSHITLLELKHGNLKTLQTTICLYNRCLGYAELRPVYGKVISNYIKEIKEC